MFSNLILPWFQKKWMIRCLLNHTQTYVIKNSEKKAINSSFFGAIPKNSHF